MLFNSYSFIFLFLPVTVLGYLFVGRWQSRRVSLTWLVVCSIAFYGLWNPINLAIILPSIAVNYLLAISIRQQTLKGEAGERLASVLLGAGVVFNLLFLGYFKYKNFFFENVNDLLGTQFLLTAVILPLGISFITFQKIAFLVDVRSGAIKDFDLYDFLTFVFFFPQLIAGPIVHYREMMPQFEKINDKLDPRDFAVGLCLFAMGLFKKVVLADGIAVHASPVFLSADQGQLVGFASAWIGALAYTFQMYFDFSGYSDMAIGLARLFGIRLPMNFNSPLKASSLIEFWSRWHITLTRFLTAYVYTPLVMNLTRSRMRRGLPVLTRKKAPLGAFLVLVAVPTVWTMLLSGFWHGAGYTFLCWGLLHGVYLCINHAWRQWRPKWDKAAYERVMRPLGFIMTFIAVVVAMVFFRAHTLDAALRVLHGMAGLEGATLPLAVFNRLSDLGLGLAALGIGVDMSSGSEFVSACLWIVGLFLVATRAPNSLDLLRQFEPALYYTAPAGQPAGALQLKFTLGWALLMSLFFVLGVLGLNRISEFLYWQF